MNDIEQMVKYERRFTAIESKLDLLIEQKALLTEIIKRLSVLEAESERRKGERGAVLAVASICGAVASWLVGKIF